MADCKNTDSWVQALINQYLMNKIMADCYSRCQPLEKVWEQKGECKGSDCWLLLSDCVWQCVGERYESLR